jgi:hypothetical protein
MKIIVTEQQASKLLDIYSELISKVLAQKNIVVKDVKIVPIFSLGITMILQILLLLTPRHRYSNTNHIGSSFTLMIDIGLFNLILNPHGIHEFF